MPERPTSVGVAGLRMVDVRHLFHEENTQTRPLSDVEGLVIHHDGVVMPAGDRDYSGSTLDEDIERLRAIYSHAIAQGWRRFPYHAAASPNGRAFLTLDPGHRGSHCRGKNGSHLGVVLLGNFMYAEPGNKQICAAGLAIAAAWGLAGRPLPAGAHRFETPPDHPTACPGDTWHDWAPRLVRATAYHATR